MHRMQGQEKGKKLETPGKTNHYTMKSEQNIVKLGQSWAEVSGLEKKMD